MVCIIPFTVLGALLVGWMGVLVDDRWIRALGYVLTDIFCLALSVLVIILFKQMKNAGIALVHKRPTQ